MTSRNKLEVGSQVAIICLCLLIGVELVWNRVEKFRASPQRSSAAPSAPTTTGVAEYVPGDKAPSLVGLEYQPRGTVLLVVRSTCHYCTDSMPFYRMLRSDAATKQVQVVALTTDPSDVCRSYLMKHGVQPDTVVGV